MDSKQSFPATGNFDLRQSSFGQLYIHNDDVISPGEGFGMHQHQDMEIVSWIMEGATQHRDTTGSKVTVPAHSAQVFSAGTGMSHSEVNAANYTSGQKLRVVQMWLPPDTLGVQPRHAEADFSDTIEQSRENEEFFLVVGGPQVNAPLAIGTTGAELQVAYLNAGAHSTLQEARYVHFYVAEGAVRVSTHTGTETLRAGDVLRLENPDLADSAEQSPVMDVDVDEDAVILAWRMDSAARD